MITTIINSIKAYFGAFEVISKLKLWKYFAIPIAISIFTAIIIMSSAYFLADDVGAYVNNIWSWEFGKETFAVISKFISGLLILIVGLILYKNIVMALSAPFMSPVSEKIEKHFLGEQHTHRKTNTSEQLIRGIRISLRNLSRELGLTLMILIIGFIPVIGLISAPLIFLTQAFYAGFGNMDYTLERHFSYKESVVFVRRNKGIAIGNGMIFILFLLIPVIGIIVVFPLSVTAATTETIKKIQVKKLPE